MRLTAPPYQIALQTSAAPPVPIWPLCILDERMLWFIQHLRALMSCPKCPQASSPLPK